MNELRRGNIGMTVPGTTGTDSDYVVSAIKARKGHCSTVATNFGNITDKEAGSTKRRRMCMCET